MLQFKDLLTQMLMRKYQVKISILKTRLVKLAYLVEVEYYRSFRERISNTEWVYYKYGPYVYGYDDVLRENEFYYKPDNYDDLYTKLNAKGIKTIVMDKRSNDVYSSYGVSTGSYQRFEAEYKNGNDSLEAAFLSPGKIR